MKSPRKPLPIGPKVSAGSVDNLNVRPNHTKATTMTQAQLQNLIAQARKERQVFRIPVPVVEEFEEVEAVDVAAAE